MVRGAGGVDSAHLHQHARTMALRVNSIQINLIAEINNKLLNLGILLLDFSHAIHFSINF